MQLHDVFDTYSLYDSFSSIPLPPVIIIVPIFGFESSSYSFDESVGIGMVAVTLDADSGQLSENLVFTFSTQDSKAESELHKLIKHIRAKPSALSQHRSQLLARVLLSTRARGSRNACSARVVRANFMLATTPSAF